MATVWKINGSALAALGVSGLQLRLVNQGVDALSFSCPLESDPGFALNTELVLTRTEGSGDPVTWFRGRLRAAPRQLTPQDESLRFEALGPWHWLERTPYLQSWKAPADPSNVASALVSYLRGRAILNQDPSGNKIDAKAFVAEVLAYCIAACTAANGGVAPFAATIDDSLAVTLPWDEVTDLSCADAIGRILSILPDTVAWIDYAPTTPVLHFSRRAALDGLTLPVLPPGDSSPFAAAIRSSIDLAPLPEQQRTKVVLIYIATHRANEAAWETYSIDAYPVGSAPNHPDALVRTIALAGGVAQSNVLQQKVDVDVIPAALVTSGIVSSGSDFSTLSAWWKNHAPDLRKSNVTIKTFRGGTRTLPDGSAVTGTLANELMKGAVTDWMEDRHGISVEDQLVQVQVDVEIEDPDISGKKERQVWPLSVVIRATNAATKTYVFTESSTATPPEEVPAGLAQAVYNAIAPLHYEGTVALTEAEPTVNILVGRALNLTGDLAAWETMDALVQGATIDLDRGQTSLRVGPPRHLGVGELTDLFRANRTRRPVTGFETRTTGRSGSAGGRQGLAYHLPAALVASRQAPPPRIIKAALTLAGVVPTSTEVATALAAAWTSPERPIAGDHVVLTVSSVPKLAYRITLSNIGTSGLNSVSFTFSSVTYYAYLTQIGLF